MIRKGRDHELKSGSNVPRDIWVTDPLIYKNLLKKRSPLIIGEGLAHWTYVYKTHIPFKIII